MSDTTFVDKSLPAIAASWLNEVNAHLYHDTPVDGAYVHGAAAISYTPPGTGAVTRSVKTELDSFGATPERFGASGDGVADDRLAVQKAIDHVYTSGGGYVDLRGNYAILSSHPTKTYTTPGDDGSVPSGYGTNTYAETVYEMPIGLWLKEGVILKFSEGASIIGDWAYATSSAINTSQKIGILLSSSSASANPKATTIRTGITGGGRVYGFMANVVSEGVLTNSSFEFQSNYSVFPFIAQGADRCDFDINTAVCKTGVIIGGQWLTRANSTAATYLPVYPAGFGTPATYPAADVHLIGWCDNCTFSSSMVRPDGLAVTIDYGVWETAIDVFFDTYFFKSASSSRLGLPTPSPASLTTYPGVVGFGVMVFSRYGRSVGNPSFANIKTYGCIRGDIYCDSGQCLSADNIYSERAGTISGVAFGVSKTDPYGSVGVASGRFIKATGSQHHLSNYYAFSSQITTPIHTTATLKTFSCFFNSSSSVFNNYDSTVHGILPAVRQAVANSIGGNNYNIATQVGSKIATTAVPLNIATISVLNTSTGYAVHGKLIVQGTARGSAGVAGYASSVYEFPIVISNNNGTLYSLGGTTASRSTIGTINAAFANITLAFACTIVGTQATVAITPTITGSLGLTTAHTYWRIEMEGAILPSITAI